MIPDRFVAHNIRPHVTRDDALSGYLQREWRSERSFLKGRGGEGTMLVKSERPQGKPVATEVGLATG